MSPPPSETRAGNVDPLLSRLIAGNFRIEKLIGSGAMGNVYKAEQLSLAKPVAVKILHAHLMGDDKLVMRFKREAKNASLLNHPNSIQIIDSGQDRDGTLFIAMELLSGRDLAQVIRDDFPLPLPRIVRIMSQTLSALDEAHTQGVVHRDLKPSNIMLIERRGEGDFVKVCDFGIAKATQDAKDDREAMLTIQGLVCGTPEYMAPEQARAEPLDGRADLYAAAVILYQMVTGDIPFKGESPMAIVSRHLAELPVVPSRKRPDLPIPQALDALILRGMEKNREMRFPTAVAFREELEAIGSGNTGRYTPTPPNLNAAMPTERMAGVGEAATVLSTGRAQPAAGPYGSTAQMLRSGRRFPAALTLLLAMGAIGALVYLRNRQADPGRAVVAAVAPLSLPAAPAAAVAAGAPPAPAPAPLAGAGIAAAPPADEPGRGAPPLAEPAPARSPANAAKTVRHKKGPEHLAAAEGTPAPGAAGAGAAPAAPAAEEAALPAPRGAREIIGEAEKLLGQGEVTEACARGEEAKRANPKFAAAYKFLGKCYMRAGDTGRGNDSYKKYLELAPNASDAMFIKSIIK